MTALPALRACFHTLVFASYPVFVVLGANAGVLPLDAGVVGRCLAVTAGGAGLLLVLLRPAVRDLEARAALLSLVFIGLSVYAFVCGFETGRAVAALYATACAVAATLIVRPWADRPRTVKGLNAVAGAALVLNLYSCAPAITRHDSWRPAADALIGEAVAAAGPLPEGPGPDIYHFILDGFGRPDVLEERFHLDLGAFVQALHARGFIVPPRGRSNYAQTYLAVSSALNLNYLDRVTDGLRESSDRRVLDYLIQHNAVSTLARRAGYRVVAVGSDYTATEWMGSADECRCERYGLHEIEATAINLTPLRALLPDTVTYGAHRRKVEAAFGHVRAVADDDRATFTFAHVLAPHPPFVFNADGRPRESAARVFSLNDGPHFGGTREEYVDGYREQARFIAARVLALVDALLARPGPSPVILLHADHGPGSSRDGGYASAGSTRERMSILSAYRLPGDEPVSLPPDVSPVNALRVMANRYLGTALPLLPDRSLASSWERPYQFVLIGAERAGDTVAHMK